MDRASGYEPGGRGFESSPVRHINEKGPARKSGALFIYMAIPGKYLENPPGFDKPANGRRRTSPPATPRRGESGKAGRINPPPISPHQIQVLWYPAGWLAPPFRGQGPLPQSSPTTRLPRPLISTPLSHPPSQASEAKPGAPLQRRPHAPAPKKCQQSTPIPPPNSPKSTTPVPHYLACCRQSRYIAPNQGAGTPPKRRRIPSKTAHA